MCSLVANDTSAPLADTLASVLPAVATQSLCVIPATFVMWSVSVPWTVGLSGGKLGLISYPPGNDFPSYDTIIAYVDFCFAATVGLGWTLGGGRLGHDGTGSCWSRSATTANCLSTSAENISCRLNLLATGGEGGVENATMAVWTAPLSGRLVTMVRDRQPTLNEWLARWWLAPFVARWRRRHFYETRKAPIC